MRTEEELLEAFDKATKENPIVLKANETDILSQALKKRNRASRGPGMQIVRDIDGYNCPVTGKWVGSRTSHKENLKRTGCRVFEPGERENYIKEKPREIERAAEKAADFLSDRIAERWDAPA